MSYVVVVTLNCDGDLLPGGRALPLGKRLERTGAVNDEIMDPDGCHWWIEHGDSTTVAAARAYGAKYGWERKRVDGRLIDLCPACAATAA